MSLQIGRMISGSKSGYMSKFPDHFVVFNANLVTERGVKVWYGDLDLTIDQDELKKMSIQMDETLYVLYEMDGRFNFEEKPKLDKAVAKITRSDFELLPRE